MEWLEVRRVGARRRQALTVVEREREARKRAWGTGRELERVGRRRHTVKVGAHGVGALMENALMESVRCSRRESDEV